MDNELVDILLATYNSNEKYLCEQIESLLNQTHKNIKIYISDDASTNAKTIQILKGYQNKDNRIILFEQQKNIGFNSNFEFLLKQSTANFLMFCDHDDIWHNDKVEKSLKKIQEYIRKQLQEDIAADQLSLIEYIDPFTGQKTKK